MINEKYIEKLEEAQLALDLKQIDKAIGLFEDILKDNPMNSRCNYGLGYCYYELEDYETAILYFKKVIETENEDTSDAYVMLGICNMFLAEIFDTADFKYEKEAIKYYSKVIDFYPKKIDDGILTDLALAYTYMRDCDNAIVSYEKLIKFDEENADAYIRLAGLYDSKGESNKALSYALKAIEIFDKSWTYYFELSLIYSNLSNFEESINALKKAVALKPDYFQAYGNMADAYNKLGKYDLAVKMATKAIDINSNDIYSICTLAEAYEHKKELDIAKRLFEKVLNIDSTFEDAVEGLKRISTKNEIYI